MGGWGGTCMTERRWVGGWGGTCVTERRWVGGWGGTCVTERRWVGVWGVTCVTKRRWVGGWGGTCVTGASAHHACLPACPLLPAHRACLPVTACPSCPPVRCPLPPAPALSGTRWAPLPLWRRPGAGVLHLRQQSGHLGIAMPAPAADTPMVGGRALTCRRAPAIGGGGADMGQDWQA